MLLNLLLILQVVAIVLLVCVVLLQKTGSDSISGLSASGPSVLSRKTSSSVLKKITFFLAAVFMLNSLMLARLTMQAAKQGSKVIEEIAQEQAQQKKVKVQQAPKVE